MEKKIRLGRIITLGLLGVSMLAALAIPSAMAKNANAANTNGQTVNQPARGEGRGDKMPPLDLKDATVTVTYLDNGTKETFVSQDKSVIAQMKQFKPMLGIRLFPS